MQFVDFFVRRNLGVGGFNIEKLDIYIYIYIYIYIILKIKDLEQARLNLALALWMVPDKNQVPVKIQER